MTRLKARFRLWKMKWAKLNVPAFIHNDDEDEILDFDHRPYIGWEEDNF